MMPVVASFAGCLIGVGLIWFGWRGKRVGDHPVCRRCDFDLFGLPDRHPACPECGAHLSRNSAIATGRRRRRPVPLAIGVSILTPAAVGAVLALTPIARGFDWDRYKPASWLAREWEASPVPARRRAVMIELLRRLEKGGLSDDLVRQSVERILLRQANRNVVWDWVDGGFVERAHARGALGAGQWERYLCGAVDYRLEVAGNAKGDTGLLWRLASNHCRLGEHTAPLRTRVELALSGIRVPRAADAHAPESGPTLVKDYMYTDGSGYVWERGVDVSDPGFVSLRPGHQTLDVTLTVDVLNRDGSGPPVATKVIRQSLPWRLLGKDEAMPMPLLRPDEGLRAAVTAAIIPPKVARDVHDRSFVLVAIHLRPRAVNLAFDVHVRGGGRTWRLGAATFPASPRPSYAVFCANLQPFPDGPLDVVLSPNPEAARRPWDQDDWDIREAHERMGYLSVADVWDGEIAFTSVPPVDEDLTGWREQARSASSAQK